MSRRADLVLVAFFVAALSAPLFCMLTGVDFGVRSSEKRALKAAPSFSFSRLAAFPREYEKYFNDNFGLRPLLVKLNSRLRLEAAGVSSNKQVVVGKDGWLFYDPTASGDGGGGAALYSAARLEEIRLELERREAFLRRRGIPVLHVVCPDKQSVYPEELPLWAARAKTTRLDQVIAYLNGRSRARVIDLRPALLREKGRGRLYFKTDTHWTSAGGFIGYLAATGRPASLAGYRLVEGAPKVGDLAEMLLLGRKYLDHDTSFEPAAPETVRKRKRVLLAYHDSFFAYMKPYLERDYAKIVDAEHASAWEKLDLSLVDKVKPDAVLVETVERYWVPE